MMFVRGVLSHLLTFVAAAAPLLAQSPPAMTGPPIPSTDRASTDKIRPATYGTSAISYVEIPAADFVPYNSGCTYTSDNSGWGPRWPTAGNCAFDAGLHLPSGAIVVYLELDFVDTNPSDSVEGSLLECSFLGQNCIRHPLAGGGPPDCGNFGGIICSGNAYDLGPGNQAVDLTPDAIVVDNFTKSYVLWTGMVSEDGSERIAGMIVGYVLQVSPAPGAPTFNDVPTSHPFFQYVEALAASGVTGGCGGGNFCPNNPITRGQMAVFLAKALGLQFH